MAPWGSSALQTALPMRALVKLAVFTVAKREG